MRPTRKVGDFGIAAQLRSTQDFAKTQIGTPYYLSPEICSERPYNRKTDIWSLGILLYEMLALRMPFEAPNLPVLIDKIVRGTPPRPPAIYSDAVCNLIQQMLNKDPKLRPTVHGVLQHPVVQQRAKSLRDVGAAAPRDATDAHDAPPG